MPFSNWLHEDDIPVVTVPVSVAAQRDAKELVQSKIKPVFLRIRLDKSRYQFVTDIDLGEIISEKPVSSRFLGKTYKQFEVVVKTKLTAKYSDYEDIAQQYSPAGCQVIEVFCEDEKVKMYDHTVKVSLSKKFGVTKHLYLTPQAPKKDDSRAGLLTNLELGGEEITFDE